MSDKSSKALEVQEKKALEASQEQTVEGDFFMPATDIFETDDALTVIMEIPGVDRENVDVQLDKNQLTITARIGLERYGELRPAYTEYGVGHFTRSFQLSSVVDQPKIKASVADGVLTLTLPKVREAEPRRIKVA